MVSAASKKFQRNFIIFSNEDNGYEEVKKPTGHVKLEIRDNREKLSAVIQNLKNGNGRFRYALYLIRIHEGAVEYVRAGEIKHSGGKAELDMIFDRGRIDGTVYSIDDFDIFAVLVETEKKTGASVICPLAAYRNGRTDWRGGLRKAMQKKSDEDSIHLVSQVPQKAGLQWNGAAPAPKLDDAAGSQYLPVFQDDQVYDPARDSIAGHVQMPDKPNNYIIQYENFYKPEQLADYHQQFELSEQYEPEYGIWPKPRTGPVAEPAGLDGQDEAYGQAEMDGEPEMYDQVEVDREPEAGGQAEAYGQQEMDGQPEAYYQPEMYDQMDVNAQLETEVQTDAGNEPELVNLTQTPYQEAAEGYSQTLNQPQTVNNAEQDIHSGSVSTAKPQNAYDMQDVKNAAQTDNYDAIKYKKQEQQPPGIDFKYPGSTNNLNTECVYLNGNFCGAVLNTGSIADPCGSCRINKRAAPVPPEVQPEGNLNGLEEELDKSFDICDPFHSRRSDYIWWRVTNPVNLNNMFYQNNIRSPLMFNPAVMMAHYKYKHLIIGVFTHKTGQRYLVCGVPGMYMIDPKPFEDMSKWVQAEGNRQRYGAFGYWLIYINPKNGRIINSGQ